MQTTGQQSYSQIAVSPTPPTPEITPTPTSEAPETQLVDLTPLKTAIQDTGLAVPELTQGSSNGGLSTKPAALATLKAAYNAALAAQTATPTTQAAINAAARALSDALVAYTAAPVETPPNNSPVATADTAVTTAGTPVSIDVLANDYDADGDTLTIDSFTQGGNGTVSQV